MKELIERIELLRSNKADASDKYPVGRFGYITNTDRLRLRHVPVYETCLIAVLCGSKIVYREGQKNEYKTGSVLAVPASSSLDMANVPDEASGQYKALVIPFNSDLLAQLGRLHGITLASPSKSPSLLAYAPDPVLIAAIKHYFQPVGADVEKIFTHRMMEILLVLLTKEPDIMLFTGANETWSQRVRSVLAEDLSRSWELKDICDRLMTTESTLRRNLKKENTRFREILFEYRLGSALLELLQTKTPISQIAYNCGYQSLSRFSENFHKRFGLPPSKMRESVAGCG